MTMELDKFKKLPDSASIWILGFEHKLSDKEKTFVDKILAPSVTNWISHRSPVEGEYTLFRDRFIILAGHCTDGISGCSIDSMMQVFKELKSSYGLNVLHSGLVFFLNDNDEIESASRKEFSEMAVSGRFTSNQTVFDLTLKNMADLRAGKFQRKLIESWHIGLVNPSGLDNKIQPIRED